MTSRRRDRRFAIISTWLRRRGFRLRTLHTGSGNPREPVCILIEKATGREVARA